MSLPGYLEYPRRQKGMDHDRFSYRNLLRTTQPAAWPNGAKVALTISIYAEFFPMDMPRQPIVPPGGMQRPGMSFWDYTLRDYGNRVAIYRLIRALEDAGMPATFAVNSDLALRYPQLIEEITRRGHEIAACGVEWASCTMATWIRTANAR